MGSFVPAVPSLMIGPAIQGAISRAREYQDQDWEKEKQDRDAYVRQLTALIPNAEHGETIDWINNEIARVHEMPRDKKFKARPVPLIPKEKQQGQGQGQSAAGQPQGATPGIDFKGILSAITGRPAGSTDWQTGERADTGVRGVTPQPLTTEGTPPDPAMMGAGAGATPPALPSALPSVRAMQPGQAIPEQSPLVAAAAAAAAGQPAATPAPMAAPAAAATAPAPATPPTPPELGSPFMGLRERTELPYQAMQKYDMNRAGKPLGNAKPLLTVKDMTDAVKAGYDLVPDSTSPTGYGYVPREKTELSVKDQMALKRTESQIALDDARIKSMSVRDRLAEERPDLMRELNESRITAAAARAADHRAALGLGMTLRVGKQYEKSIQVFRDTERSLSQLEAMISEATGPGDYGSIIQFVHGLDNTAAREGEVAMARSAASLANRLEQAMARFTAGEILAPEVRKQFLSAARASNAAFQQHRRAIDEQYGYIADEYQLDPRMIGIPGTRGAGGAGRKPADAATGDGKMYKKIRNKRTGVEVDGVSTDGGKTWQPVSQ